jgi:alpha-beta hydrolase superfamily lysophospholipase
MCIAHGVGEHSGCYETFATYFAAHGAAVYAQDHRGFGRSGGRRGHISRYEQAVNDLKLLVERARSAYPSLPLILVGHSMGGTLALLFALHHPDLLDYAIFSAPALIVGLPVPLWKRTLGRTLSRLYPTYTDVAVFNPDLLTRDPVVQQSAREDELRHTRKTARLYTEMFVRGPRDALARAGSLRVPYLVLHGADDPLVPVAASWRLYDTARATSRTMHVYPGLRHEIFREVERERVYADIMAWLAEQGIALTPAVQTATS